MSVPAGKLSKSSLLECTHLVLLSQVSVYNKKWRFIMHSVKTEHSFKCMITLGSKSIPGIYGAETVWLSFLITCWIVVKWHWVKVAWRAFIIWLNARLGLNSSGKVTAYRVCCIVYIYIKYSLLDLNFASTSLKLCILSWSVSMCSPPPPPPQLLSLCFQWWRLWSFCRTLGRAMNQQPSERRGLHATAAE